MGRSKNLHFVQHEVTITQPPSDAEDNWAEGYIQVDDKLSKELGLTVRNGNSFRLVGFGAALRSFTGSSDFDVGFAGTAVIQYCPLTKNGVAAHQGLYKQWMRQKQLSGNVGAYVRYDDFEVGWNVDTELSSARNSQLFTTGMGDTTEEDVVIYGVSVDGASVSLEDYYDSLNPIADVSKTPFGVTIKTAKFTDKFPSFRQLMMPCSFSAQVAEVPAGTSWSGAISTGDISWLPADNHLSHMTGTLRYYFKGIQPDTDIPPATPDQLKLIITLVYEGWSSLAPPANKKLTSKTARKTLRGKR